MNSRARDKLIERILAWYAQNGRELPWRQNQEPYFIWVSEIMLQQTQVETVIPYYRHFISRFPSVQALASASLQDVLKAWENLGYYTRARHLHAAARTVKRRWNGKIPNTWDDIISLPGVGDYTAGAILSIAFGKRLPAVDGNVRRVLARLFAVEECLDNRAIQQHLRALAEHLVPATDPGSFNQALMELGATICKPRRPTCPVCPIQELCRGLKRGLQDVLPRRRKRGAVPHQQVTAGVVKDERGRVLIVQRQREGLLGALWKFPGGRQKPGETLSKSLRTRVYEEVGIRITVGEAFVTVNHAYTHFRITLNAFLCDRREGEPQALKCAAWQWVAPFELDDFPFSKADRQVVRAFRAHHASSLDLRQASVR